MRRYTSLLLTAFVLVLVALAGTSYLAGYADQTEKSKTMQTLTVYTTLPAENAALLAAEYEKVNKVRVNFVPLSEKDLLARLKETAKAPSGQRGDMVLADSKLLQQAAADEQLAVYSSEQSDSVPEDLKDDQGCWTGVWYDPIVFCVNRDYLRSLPRIPQTWQDLAGTIGVRIGITDFLAADASANLLFTLISQYGEDAAYGMLRQLHPKIVQYSKYLSTPVRMAGMGEVDVSIAVQSETLRYINDGYPLKIVYPTDGTAYMLTAAGILKNADHPETAADFMEWLLGDEAQLVLQKNNFFFVPVNRSTFAYKTFAGKNIVLFGQPQSYTPEQKHTLLDRWVKNIRFK